MDKRSLRDAVMDKWKSGDRFSFLEVVKLIDQFEESKKPAVPEFVAEWYEKNRFSGWWNWLYKWGKEPIEDELEKRVHDWFIDYHEYDFVDMHRFGYTVEKEKKYRVKDKNDCFLLIKNLDGEVINAYGKVVYEKSEQLTEQEIKDYDERFWPFAEEVSE